MSKPMNVLPALFALAFGAIAQASDSPLPLTAEQKMKLRTINSTFASAFRAADSVPVAGGQWQIDPNLPAPIRAMILELKAHQCQSSTQSSENSEKAEVFGTQCPISLEATGVKSAHSADQREDISIDYKAGQPDYLKLNDLTNASIESKAVNLQANDPHLLVRVRDQKGALKTMSANIFYTMRITERLNDQGNLIAEDGKASILFPDFVAEVRYHEDAEAQKDSASLNGEPISTSESAQLFPVIFVYR